MFSKLRFICVTALLLIITGMSVGLTSSTRKAFYDYNDNQLSQKSYLDLNRCTVKIENTIVYEDVIPNPEDKKTEESIYFSTGSGFSFLRKNDRIYILTCEHVIDYEEFPTFFILGNKVRDETRKFKERIIKIIFNGKRYDAKFEFADPDKDFAVISVDAFEVNLDTYSNFADENKLKVGQLVSTFGFPGSYPKLLLFGRLAGDIDAHEDYYYVSKEVNFGDSGGPVFVFENGIPFIIGINRYKFDIDGVSGIAKIKYAIKMIKENKLM